MVDYTKQQAWADKRGEDILAAEHDTELDLIATAVTSKSEVAPSPTVGNVAERNAAGKMIDSGIASSRLDNVSSPVQTQLDAKADNAPATTNHVLGGQFALEDGESSAGVFDFSVVPELTWESVGPTGSGADNIWAALDVVPSEATALIVVMDLQTICDANTQTLNIWVESDKDSTPSTDISNELYKFNYYFANSGTDFDVGDMFLIPIDTSQKFQMYWQYDNGVTISVADFAYRGFLVN